MVGDVDIQHQAVRRVTRRVGFGAVVGDQVIGEIADVAQGGGNAEFGDWPYYEGGTALIFGAPQEFGVGI